MQIFWNDPEGVVDVYGIYLFGLFESVIPSKIFETIAAIWGDLLKQSELNTWDYHEGVVCDIAIRVNRNSDEPLDLGIWISYVEASLAAYIHSGAIAAWAGFEDSSPCPEIFDPNVMAGNAFAVATKKLGFICDAVPEDPIRPLTISHMNSVWPEIQRKSDSE